MNFTCRHENNQEFLNEGHRPLVNGGIIILDNKTPMKMIYHRMKVVTQTHSQQSKFIKSPFTDWYKEQFWLVPPFVTTVQE